MTQHPNILFLMSDQHQAAAMGCAGHPDVQTPNLDALASHSHQYTNAFCQSPVCVAARGSLITSLYPHQHGALLLEDALSDKLQTIAHHFAEADYHTAAIGRMHFVDESRRHGFMTRINEHDFENSLTETDRQLIQANRKNGGSVNGVASDLPTHCWQDTFFADQTVQFLEQQRDSDKPFLLFSSYFKPHTPLNPIREFYDLYDPNALQLPERRNNALQGGFEGHLIRAKERGWYEQSDDDLRKSLAGYYGNITQVDACIGRVIDTLERHGLADNTIIVYTSDHGEMAGAHRMWTKHVMFDQAVNVPLLIHLPGESNATTHDDLVAHVDLYPTLARLAGLELPDAVHGRSFAGLVNNDEYSERDYVFAEYNFCRNVFTSDNRYVGKPPIRMVRSKEWKLNQLDWAKDELYDLKNDPGEHHNLIDSPAHANIVTELRNQIQNELKPA
jgi:choline-sulfatase